jgi:hypothetical protein
MFTLTDAEFAGFQMLPEADLADLAVELEVVPASEIDARGLLGELVIRILERAKTEGLPFSKWDKEDLESLPQEHLRALASAMNWPSDIESLLKLGGKVYKEYRKTRRNSQVAIMLPLLLGALARHAYEKV